MSDNHDHEATKRDQAKEAELRRATRRQRAIERLRVKNPKCLYCNETDPLVLERHHLAGREYDNDTIIVCRNHHRKLSGLQKDHPGKIADPPDTMDVAAHFLLGVADLFELLVTKFREFAAQLLERADPNRDNVEPQP